MNFLNCIRSRYEQVFVAAFEAWSTKVVERKVLDLQVGAHRAIEDDDAFFECFEKVRHICNNKGPALNNAEPETCSPSCLADYFTWPQVALTHHVKLSKCIETHPVNPVNPGILWKVLINRPKLGQIQLESGEQRITGDRLRII